MQMTGYMFRSAEYRQFLQKSLGPAEPAENALPATEDDIALPPVSGKITVKISAGMEAKVDAQAYMTELRKEVEGLRAEIVASKMKKERDGGGSFLNYMESLTPQDVESITKGVSPDIFEAMGQLVRKLLQDINIPYDNEASVTASAAKLRELLIVQLVSGYRLKEMEVKDTFKDKYWS
jgi:hypothetical protein